MDVAWQELLGNMRSLNTRNAYSSAQKQFVNFCTQNGFLHANGSTCPASELTILRFIGNCSASKQASTLRVYLSAIRALHVQSGYPDPLINCLRIPLAIKGLRRSQSLNLKPAGKLPITALVLLSIKSNLNVSDPDDAMLWAACCTAFFGFLRAAEFTCSPSQFQEGVHLSLACIKIDKSPIPDTVHVYLPRSKTDQFGKGCSILLARSDCALCPVAALMSYLMIRGSSPGPLFRFSDGSPLSKSKLFTNLQRLLSQAGWQGRYTLHSFRVGAATTAASLGFPTHLIQALGRWSSDAYKVYIRLPEENLRQASLSLATFQ